MVFAQERRTDFAMAEVVDEALATANECGWRYALAYLLHHRASPHVIQRLLSGARVREHKTLRAPGFNSTGNWRHSSDEYVAELFDLLQQRRRGAGGATGWPSLRPAISDGRCEGAPISTADAVDETFRN